MKTHLGIGVATGLLTLSIVSAPTFAAVTPSTLQKEVATGWKSIATHVIKDQKSVKQLVNQVQKIHHPSDTKVAITDLQHINALIGLLRKEHMAVLKDLKAKNRNVNTVQARKAWGQLKKTYNNEHKLAELMAKKLTALINKSASPTANSGVPPTPPAPPAPPAPPGA